MEAVQDADSLRTTVEKDRSRCSMKHVFTLSRIHASARFTFFTFFTLTIQMNVSRLFPQPSIDPPRSLRPQGSQSLRGDPPAPRPCTRGKEARRARADIATLASKELSEHQRTSKQVRKNTGRACWGTHRCDLVWRKPIYTTCPLLFSVHSLGYICGRARMLVGIMLRDG